MTCWPGLLPLAWSDLVGVFTPLGIFLSSVPVVARSGLHAAAPLAGAGITVHGSSTSGPLLALRVLLSYPVRSAPSLPLTPHGDCLASDVLCPTPDSSVTTDGCAS